MENTENKIPTIAIVGRPNVGKSTIFNRLTGKWQSIVEDRPGITRDRLYGQIQVYGHILNLMDTGGLNLSPKDKLEKKMSIQATRGIEEADLILFVMDGRDGVTPMDEEWIHRTRKINKPKLFIVNKIDNSKLEKRVHQFHELGIDPIVAMSAEKKKNFLDLGKAILEILNLPIQKKYLSIEKNPHKVHTLVGPYKPDKPKKKKQEELSEEEIEKQIQDSIQKDFKIAIIGRPNVGKSTLLNAILDEDRSIVDDTPGTTRDPIHSYLQVNGKPYCLIDTAGIRKRAKTKERVEKFSVVASLKEIDQADLVLLLIDGEVGPTEQDAHVAGYAYEKQKAMIIIVNKWDLGTEKYTREFFEGRMELKMNFLKIFPVLYISAKTKKNLKKIFPVIEQIREQYEYKVKTSHLNDAFKEIVDHHPLPTYKGQNIKMFYVTQGGVKPPTFIVFCNQPKHVHFSYKRYLQNAIREMFGLDNIPIRIVFKQRKSIYK